MNRELIQKSFLASSIVILTLMFVHTVGLIQASENQVTQTTSEISAFKG